MVSTEEREMKSVSSSVGNGSSCLDGVDFPSPRIDDDLRDRGLVGVLVLVCWDKGAWVRMISDMDGMTGFGAGGGGEGGGEGIGSSLADESLKVRMLSCEGIDFRLVLVKVLLEGFREAVER